MADKYLILGASSFYGANFIELLKRKGDEVLLPQEGWRLGDRPEGLFDADYIVNFASQSLVEPSWDDPERWCNANLSKTAVLFKSLVKHPKLKKFVHVSTPESYGDTEGWVDETYKDWRPSTPYGVSRAAADFMLLAYQRAFGIPACITRTANIYGRGQGENRIIPLAFKTLGAGQPLPLHAGGSTRRSFIHVSDACEATYRVAKSGTPGHTYHISTTTLTTISELCLMIARMLNKPESLIGSQPERLGKDITYALDSTRLRNMGWRDKITLTTGLAEYGRRD